MSQLTEQDMKDLAATFKMFDKDGNGSIDQKELVSVLRCLGQNPTNSEVSDLIKSMDRSGNGKIEYREFVDCVNKKGMKTEEQEAEEVRAAFKIFDANGDGFITAAELRRIVTSMGERLTEEEADAMIKKADQNGDGRINYEEFAQIITRNNAKRKN
ncbi:hypothetical protein BsWGS_14833 [Bradybaena similaris]